MRQPVQIDYYSDVLCIWAYVAQRRVEELVANFGDRIEIHTRYCSVFSDVEEKIGEGWASRGGYRGYAKHVREIVERFGHVELHDGTWFETKPRSSASAHLFLGAVDLLERERDGEAYAAKPYLERRSTRAAWALRKAFFAEARDIDDWRIHREVAAAVSMDYDEVMERQRVSDAVAKLAQDYGLSQRQGVQGSPTFLMNSGRQKLFGNVGYRVLEANVEQLLRDEVAGQASWC